MTHMHSITRRQLGVLAVLALVAAGCGGGAGAGSSATTTGSATGARPSSPAVLTIISPKNGQMVHGSVLHIRLGLKNARIVRPTSSHITPTTGHIHVYLDDQIVSMNYTLDNTIHVTPGEHVLRIEFVASDHLPFDPRVVKAVVFEVKK
jgi:Family of unknown function (DUF6130)